MTHRLLLVLLSLTWVTGVIAGPSCEFEATTRGTGRIGRWIEKSNWLEGMHRRATLQAADVFMPARRLLARGDPLKVSAKALSLDKIQAIDPLDGTSRSVQFVLDSRLEADGIVVLYGGQVVAERYRNGLQMESPRLLLDATRPLLNVIGAIGLAQGKFAADWSVSRAISPLRNSIGLRKFSVQRLLENKYLHEWTPEDLSGWRQAAGWTEMPGSGIRAWLAASGRWDKPAVQPSQPLAVSSPEDDLLAWLLTESYRQPLSLLFCEQLQSRNRPEFPVLWLADGEGTELGNGLAISLRDFTRLGQQLLGARANRSQTHIPAWLVETLAAPARGQPSMLPGLPEGSEMRFGFVHLGGRANSAALIGSDGASLFIDFDQRLVIGIYASYRTTVQPSLLASLDAVWKAIHSSLTRSR